MLLADQPMELCVPFKFRASHSLSVREETHWHDWGLKVFLSRKVYRGELFVADIVEIRKLIQPVLDSMEGEDLNEQFYSRAKSGMAYKMVDFYINSSDLEWEQHQSSWVCLDQGYIDQTCLFHRFNPIQNSPLPKKIKISANTEKIALVQEEAAY
jgi:6-pyruvoyl-tetrahydropterin synthase